MKVSTRRDYRLHLNRVMLYIQDHLDETLRLDALAREAAFSPFHFHRIFTAFTGQTLFDFVRRLRLEQAARRLATPGLPVTEAALLAGYDTPAAFTRAFRAHFGLTPTRYRQKPPELPPLSLPLLNPDENEEEIVMQPEIRTIEPMHVVYVRRTGPYAKSAEEAFGILMPFAYRNRLTGKQAKCIGISHDDPVITPEGKLRYDACLTVPPGIKPEGEIQTKVIPGGKYAVFLHRGPYEKLSETYTGICKGWAPECGLTFRNEPPFELYLNRDPRRTKPENLRTEIWIPLA